jgi:alpha-L-rhamnosidase
MLTMLAMNSETQRKGLQFLIAATSLVLGLLGKLPAQGIWQAQWIGPTPMPTMDLHDASWIWSKETHRNARPVFRREIALPEDAQVASVTALFSADNHYRLRVNGTILGGSSDWQHPRTIDLTAAWRNGTNTILVQAQNDVADAPTQAAGLMGKILISFVDGSSQTIVTDANWQCLSSLTSRTGQPAKILGAYGMEPWGEIKAPTNSTNLWTCYRKSIMLAQKPHSARARIAVDSKYWLWINGKLAVYEGSLKRGPTPHDTYFDEVELAPFLQAGNNTIAVLTWHWGKDGYSHKNSGKNGFLFELDADATFLLGSDATWKAQIHPAFGRTGEPHPNYRMPDENVHFDARLDFPGWTSPDFDDTKWKPATTLGSPPTAPWNQLIRRPIPQWRVSELLAYENAQEFPKKSHGQPIIARLPKNITISPYLKIRAPAGLTIDMRTDNYKGGSEYNFRSEYVTKEGIQEFESFPYLNGHWLIYQIPAGVEILDLRYRESRYDTDFVGAFESDDPFLDSLWLKARNTMNINMRDSIQDPDRERAQWWGDIVILMNQILYTCDDRSIPLIRKAIDNLIDWQRADGVLYSPVPAGSWHDELPMQMLLSIGEKGFWNYYQQTGDRSALEKAYPAIARYLALWTYDENGLSIHRAGGWDWGDWGDNIDMPLMENALLYQAFGTAIEIARMTGHEADIPAYESKRKRIAESYQKIFWNGREYRSPQHQGKTDDRGHALAVIFGLAPRDQWPAIHEVLQREFHSSPYMEKFVIEALFQMNFANTAISRMKSRYTKMVESPLTTLWEGWGVGAEGYGGGSYNHGWAGGPITLLHEYSAGIQPTSPGYATYRVKPQLGPLRSIDCTSHTIKGLVKVHIRHLDKAFHLKLTSPEQTIATVCLPLKQLQHSAVRVNKQSLWSQGKALETVPGITVVGIIDDHVCFEVASGSWHFESR